ncbi:mannose-1-phosphate guanylyltransferase/mannose-6-phosphate isomerase [Vibrio gazogenes]|uniref:mannose-1-phosphate guanylyltransferase n=1 Tax=Vibrio gazogenes DSM 21264 = NBRC 103151 TaxID=1123492 RepID=A0A1M5D233_VIBGA|nr:mannose-1-phosphate guanylyltransferase/mannose-6-phosphate isomerase [Vibrio gazogenes]USP13928.1 mannose-1-phosphate guanylyltransferase/mannose-6-phosphate isomerase [Vibrio gazogenes]SHF61093.1 mannose-1-phosphate guanylyltransferase (GDP) /mannose-6-phosphate isomerase, type 2 [Vibrio gazogenes DSM 21264] [Vibrio gazogenes DSM 21264 = NBRC 103151]
MILPVIMCGGAGSRLWPLSRTAYPKQFLSLVSEQTMLQDTVHRLDTLAKSDPLFICNEEHRFIVAEQLRSCEMSHSGIILEPVGRNTAPAIALAALKALQNGDDPLLLILAADHVIQDSKRFVDVVERAVPLAEQGKLVTFGIVPTKPHTGYGYILQGEPLPTAGFEVAEFIEKPDLSTAEHYLQVGGYLWNSGMFLFKASCYLEELRRFRPDIFTACETAFMQSRLDLDFIRINADEFMSCPDESIDYAVMENTQSAAVIPMDAGWSDVGSWSSLWEVNRKDQDGNTSRGDVLIEQTSNSYIYSEDRLVAAVGVDGVVIVETKDAVLVANKEKVQLVKQIVEQLKDTDRCEHLRHREVLRPWGSHDEIAEGERYLVKKVMVKPGQRTATQMHYHRAEHWIVVSGTAKVYNGDKSYLVSENESTYIPIGAPHAFENPGKVPLEIIEVRSGSYLAEDDIIRLDSYGVGY